MSMLGDIATEQTVKTLVEKIEKDLQKNKKKPAVVVALKEVGRFALEQFDWDTPQWAAKYEKLFK